MADEVARLNTQSERELASAAEYQRLAQLARDASTKLADEAAELEQYLADLAPLSSPVDLSSLQAQIQAAEATNRAYDAAQKRKSHRGARQAGWAGSGLNRQNGSTGTG